MMHEREKSDPAVVAVKPVNNAERSAAEPVEPRAGAKGNAEQHSTCRAQYRVSVSQALERIRQVRRHSPEVGAVCGKAARTDLCGGRSEMSVPTAIVAGAPRNDGLKSKRGLQWPSNCSNWSAPTRRVRSVRSAGGREWRWRIRGCRRNRSRGALRRNTRSLRTN